MTKHNNKLRSVAIIPDGNRRWAIRQGASVEAAYDAVARTIDQVSTAFLHYDVEELSIFALSKNNLKRDASELRLTFRSHIRLINEVLPSLVEMWDAHLFHVGDLSMLPDDYANALTSVVEHSGKLKGARRFYLYAGYDREWEESQKDLNGHALGTAPRNIDLLLRTGGEYRLSGFTPRALEYAELFFIDTLFPDLDSSRIDEIVRDFYFRHRRFGL